MDETTGRIVFLLFVLVVVSIGVLSIGLRLFLKSYLGKTRLLSLSPRVVSGENYLVARTHRLVTWLTLGLCGRTVLVDRIKKHVIIRSRWLWLFPREKRLPFSAIEAVLYGYSDLNPFTAIGFTGDTLDMFSVKLQLYKGNQVHLLHFCGEGTVEIGPATPECVHWMFWLKRRLDFSGAQEEDSRSFVNRVSNLIGVEVRRA
jgi:hypothetical protein